jgi:uncharacterized protein (TIGR04255 family)
MPEESKRKRYKNPPIIEAICAFHFLPSTAWDLAIPGLIYERIRDIFPERRAAKSFEVEVSSTPEGVEQQVVAADIVQFLRRDGRVLVQVSPHLLSVNHVQPYSTWEEFRPLIEKVLMVYLDETNQRKPNRVELRYINQINIKLPASESIELSDYFSFYPYVGPGLPQDYGAFIAGVQTAYEDPSAVLKIQLTNLLSGGNHVLPAILDLSCTLGNVDLIASYNLSQWIETAHDRIENVFEAVISDRLRKQFQRGTK